MSALRRRLIAAGAFAALAANLALARAEAASMATWQAWQHLPGVFDLAGPRPDGTLVAAAAGRLYQIAPDGRISPFAGGPEGYRGTDGAEAYIALSPGLAGSGCRFASGDLFVLDLGSVPGVIQVSPDGHATAFASVPAAKTLSGIVFDTGGSFGHRLLVAGPATGGDGMVVAAIDCRGGVTMVGHGLPAFEGGFAIAPAGFGAHAGELVVPDELSGRILGITPSGQAVELAASGIDRGGDIGVESAGVVPLSGGVLVSDRGTPGSPHPGTDSVLRIEQPALAAAGVAPGDILIASEGGAVTVDLRCAASCSVRTVASGPSAAHGEGHLLGLGPVPTAAAPSPAATSTHPGGRGPLIRGIVALLAGLIVFVGTRRLRARARRQRAAG